MKTFSERYGYVKPSDVIIREEITPEIRNAICSAYDDLKAIYNHCYYDGYLKVESHIWYLFLNKRKGDYYNNVVATEYINADKYEWYKKLDLIEFTISFLYEEYSHSRMTGKEEKHLKILNTFINSLNFHFKRLNFAYRIVDGLVVEITSEEEVKTIETALAESSDGIKEHLSKALELYAKRPEPDCRNSIKESISAVEVYCREKTSENTLGKALKKLEEAGIVIPKLLSSAFEKLYAYTNQPDTGIRHGLMDDEGTYIPGQEEAFFMLVSCSSFINYLRRKE